MSSSATISGIRRARRSPRIGEDSARNFATTSSAGTGLAASPRTAVVVSSSTQGDYATARRSYEACLRQASALGDKELLASCLEGLAAAVAAQAGETGPAAESCWAAQLWGAAARLREAIGAPLPPAARKYPEWWANDHSPESKGRQCYAWLEAGWLVDRALLNDELVCFKRGPSATRR